MSDQPPGQATDQVATHTIVDAARLLGVSENAVRKRIRRGTLPAHKEGDRWLVAIPTTPATTDLAGDYPSATTDLANDQVAAATGQATDLAAAITPLAALIERLTAENRELAEAATIWQVRAHHLEEQMKQLTAGQDAPVAAQAPPHQAVPANAAPAASVPWWAAWWHRLIGGSR